MKSEVYEIRTLSDFVVCQYLDYEMLERYLKTKHKHLTNYKIVKITKEEETIYVRNSDPKAETHGESV